MTREWVEVVALHVDLANRRVRGEMVSEELAAGAAEALRTIAQQTTHQDALIATMVERLGLSAEQELAAWTLVASQLAPAIAGQLEGLSGGPEVTKGALAAIAYASAPARAIRELAPAGRLFRFGLIEHVDAVATSWARRTVRANERLLALAMMETGDVPFEAAYVIASEARTLDELAIAEDTIDALRGALTATRAIVIVSGSPGAGRRTAVAAAARSAGLVVREIDARRMAKDHVTFAGELRAIARECRILGRVPLIANVDALADDKEPRLEAVGTELVALVDGLVLATAGVNVPAIRWDRPVIAIEMTAPTSAQRATVWLAALGQGSQSDGELLAGQYPLAPALIVRAGAAARARAAHRKLEPADIYAGVRAVLDDRLGAFARRVAVTQTWDDLVLPADQIETITELLSRVRDRRRVYEQWGFAKKLGKGLGVSALFSGPPGTGKTMVAALIARDLGLELYQVDLGKVVSKWIGESEKNLGVLFDAAEAGHAVLLFDEADSLFGKRTDVKSSNDRYANLETNYLLQRLESFTGTCLLTSNHESNIDPAFLRRLSLHVRFELPNDDEREHLWRVMLPLDAPVAGELDFSVLARRYAMSGGYIRNAALRAAFFAADEHKAITSEHLERAARLEYESMGKIAA